MISKIKEAAIKCEAGNLFGSPEDELASLCVDFLKSKGYKVYKPSRYTYNNVKHIDDLIEFFYKLYYLKHPHNMSISRQSLKKERAIAKSFVDSRMKAGGLSKQLAMSECCEIIQTFFDFEEHFKFDGSIPLTFIIFGQDNFKWVTEKAVSIINNRERLIAEKEHIKIHDELYERYNSEPDDEIGFNLEDILKKVKGDADGT
jgi:hypothetical protein